MSDEIRQAYASEILLRTMIRRLPTPGSIDRYNKERMEQELDVLKDAAYHRGFVDGASEAKRREGKPE